MFRKIIYVSSVCILPIFFEANSSFFAQSLGDYVGATMVTIVFTLVFNKHLERRLKQN